MNIYTELNKLITYIEENLENDINYNEVAKILGTNLYTAESLFKFLTGITIKEYVRYRRLTLAAKDIKEGKKIIDVAMKYNYSNPASFTRSFKIFHKVNPRSIKNEKNPRVFPIIHFEQKLPNTKNINYKIVNNKKFTIYTIKEEILIDSINLIEKFWEKIKHENKEFKNADRRYGFSENNSKSKNSFYYHIGLDKKWANATKLIIPSQNWFVIDISSFKGQDITKNIDDIKNTYLPSLNYSLKEKSYLEIYHTNFVELWFSIN